MFRKALWLLLFFSFHSLADPTATQDVSQEVATQAPMVNGLVAEHAMIKNDMEAAGQRINQLETSWKNTTSEMNRDLIQQQAVTDIRNTSRRIDKFLEQARVANTPEAIALAEDLVKDEIRFFEARLTSASTDLSNLFAQYEKSSADEQLLVLFNINDFYAYINWLISERAANIKLLEGWQIDTTAEQQQLNREITNYADFMTAYLRNNTRMRELLENEITSLPADARTAMETRVATQNRLVQSAVNNLREVVVLMAAQGLPVDHYNELIFKTTGNLAEAVVDFGTLKTVVIGFYEDFVDWIKSNIGGLISRLLLFTVLMGAAVLIARLVRRVIARAVTHKRAKLSTLVQEFFVKIGGNIVVVFGLLFALAQVGLDLTPVLTGLGVAGIVIGFALQDTLSNFASGMMILIYRPFDVGDFVEAGGVAGKVGKMSLVNTTIRTFDNQVFLVPNAKIWGETIKNLTSERLRRVDMVFGVSYGDDVVKVEEILHDIVTGHPKVLSTPEHMIRVQLLNESSVDFIVRPWVKTEDYWDVYWDITREVKVRFDREGITIPFPQRELHIHGQVKSDLPVDRATVRQLDCREQTVAC